VTPEINTAHHIYPRKIYDKLGVGIGCSFKPSADRSRVAGSTELAVRLILLAHRQQTWHDLQAASWNAQAKQGMVGSR
jgi:hypothetical protein